MSDGCCGIAGRHAARAFAYICLPRKPGTRFTDASSMNPYINSSYWTEFITSLDFVLLPFYLALVYFFAFRFANKHYRKNDPMRRYFLWGFTLKIFGAIFIGLVYQYYYGGGDTSAFFYHAKVINQSMDDSFFTWLNLVLHIPDGYDINYFKYTNQMLWYVDPSSYMVSAIAALFGTLTFNTFLPISVLFAAVSFTGNWAMFRTFTAQYPKLVRPLALAILFIPSTFVWGSGIFKDTICIAALGWLTLASFRMLINRKFRLNYLLIILFCFYVLLVVKVYIVLVFIPALAIWILNTYSENIRNSSIRAVLKIGVYAAILGGFASVASSFSQELGKYSLENLAGTSNTTREYLLYISKSSAEEGSAYDLGEFDPSITGMLSKFPLAVNVTLFRPYLWEARKPIVFLNALEAFLFLFFTLKIIFVIGLRKAAGSIGRSPNIQFFLVFTVVFAFAVGISSYNFGALSRYRIPCLPFYAMALMLIYYDHKPSSKPFFTFKFS